MAKKTQGRTSSVAIFELQDQVRSQGVNSSNFDGREIPTASPKMLVF